MSKNKFLKNLNLAIHITRDAKKDDDVQWITKKGHHLAVNGEGEIVAGGIPNTNIGKGTKLNGSSTKGESKSTVSSKLNKANELSSQEFGIFEDDSAMVWDIHKKLKKNINEMSKEEINQCKGELDKLLDYGHDTYNNYNGKYEEQAEEDFDKFQEYVETLMDVCEEAFDAKSVKDAIPGGTQMANYKYDPMLCMNVPAENKAQDAKARDYSLATEEYFGDLIKRFLNSRPDFVQAGFDYLFEEGNYSDDEKGFEKAKNDYIRELQQEADTMKREVNQIIDQGNRKHIAEVRRMKY